ncbi:Serine/threonine protein kinase [Sporothrix eucalyptigena]|uniref:Autophagy-related protein 1 n=1 Tax=Sporothrix eucalyptigena TaxID=1812306 RepID=A0ABP0ATY3_9PEZI
MQNVLVSSGLPTPPASPLSFDYPKCAPHNFFQQQQPSIRTQQQHPQQRYVPVAPADRIGTYLGNLQLTGIIGTGAYGVVYEAVDVKTGVHYAVKALSKLNADGTPLEERQIEYQTREIRLHYMASAHPNVVSMHKIIDIYPDCLFVVLEYCAEGDLFYNITECGHFVGKDELARKVFCQILDAVQYLHSKGIYHRDLKPENILVADCGETLKLADFGLATASERSEDYGCGSTFYMSPECLGQNSKRPYYYCAPNDIWSLGVILVNLTCGRNPWKQASIEDSTYRAYARNPKFLKTILPLSDELDDILARIFAINPDQRITLPELKQRILACKRFTVSPQEQAAAAAQQARIVSPPSTPSHNSSSVIVSSSEYAVYDDDEEDEDEDLFENDAILIEADAPLSPASSANESSCFSDMSDAVTECASPASSVSDDCVSLDVSLVADDDDDSELYLGQDDLPEIVTPPPPSVAVHPPPQQQLQQQQQIQQQQILQAQAQQQCMQVNAPVFYESEDAAMLGVGSVAPAAFHHHHQHQQYLQQQQAPIYHFPNYAYDQQPMLLPPQQQPLPTPPPTRQPQTHQTQLPLPPPPPQQAPVCAPNGMPVSAVAASSKFFFPNVWGFFAGKNNVLHGHVQPLQHHLQQIHHMPAFHQQMHGFMQGCY